MYAGYSKKFNFNFFDEFFDSAGAEFFKLRNKWY